MRKLKVVCLLLAVILASGFIGACADTSSDIKIGDTDVSGSYIAKDTNHKLVDNGASDYVIVYPVIDGADKCKEASDVLFNYIRQSTNAELSVKSDKNYIPADGDKVISLGNTTVAKEKNIVADAAELGEDGYYLKTLEDDLFIQGCTDNAVLFGVYDFLTYQFGIEFYSYDEIKIPASSTVYLKDFDLKSVPAFANRCLDLNYFNPNSFNETYEKMMKLNSGHGRGWITWAHTHFSLMPKETYLKDHSDYYSTPDQSQLCLTNEEMIAELCKNIQKRLAETSLTNSEYNFMIGQEDQQTFCNCPKCQTEKERLGSESGVMMQFINKVADIMNPYVEETYPGKKIYWVTFAYHNTEEPPVVKNADGSFSVYHEDVKAHENVGVLYAPIFFDHYHDVDDKKYNSLLMDEMQGWKETGATMFVWTYAAVYYSGFCFFDDYHTVKNAYKAFKDMGAVYLFTETDWRIGDPFHALSFYVRAKLMWDLDSDVNALINQFIDEYYKAGAPQVNYALPFDDVAEGAWYTEAVRWAASEGIVTGMSATAFEPNAPITREQFAAILYRYAQKTGADVSAGEDTNILSYADALDVSEYAVPAMQWACGAGVIQGSGANLNPKDGATRAEAAAMLMRFCQTVQNA